MSNVGGVEYHMSTDAEADMLMYGDLSTLVTDLSHMLPGQKCFIRGGVRAYSEEDLRLKKSREVLERRLPQGYRVEIKVDLSSGLKSLFVYREVKEKPYNAYDPKMVMGP
ncbi:hypothetical protein J4413_03690 [Candidatus Woesearchaeota archaeon]|nr:hypothetical protein [Candidatus Woesearchaeota archaeon]